MNMQVYTMKTEADKGTPSCSHKCLFSIGNSVYVCTYTYIYTVKLKIMSFYWCSSEEIQEWQQKKDTVNTEKLQDGGNEQLFKILKN